MALIYDGLRVVDLTSEVAGAYCTKLLTDLGADVVVAPASDAPLGGRAELFTYLRSSQTILGPGDDPAPWIAAADVVVGGYEVLGDDGTGPAPVTVSISTFGHGGPDSGRELPEPVLQARSGSLSVHGHMHRAPLTVGGELGEYVTGVFAALGAVTAWWRSSRSGMAETVDVSMLEAMHFTLVTYPTLMARFPGGRPMSFRWVMIPGNEPCADGNYAGITTVTAQQWRSLLGVMGEEDRVADDELSTMLGRFKRAKEVNGLLRHFTMQMPAAEVVERCATGRVPATVVGNGELLPEFEQVQAREVFVRQPSEDWIRPRSPFHFARVPGRAIAAPTAAPTDVRVKWTPREESPARARDRAPADRPFRGLRVLDFTAFWSGPFATAWLCALGADVIKVESIQRPDGIRFSSAVGPKQDPRFYEVSALFHATNLGKRGITLDLGHPDGNAIARRLIATADVVCDNFTPRVMESFGLSYDEVAAIRPDVVMLRLSAFGLTGPWRDRPGFAQTMEQLTGMAWLTGYEGGPPIIPGGIVDPMVGAHAALALVAALEHRARTGKGQLVEMAMLEVAAAVTAEQVIERSAHGRLMERRGEHGVYRCSGDDAWVAVDEQSDPQSRAARAEWCATRAADVAASELLAEGIPAARVVPAFATLDDPQLRARGFFQTLEHPVAGAHEFPGWPMRMSQGPAEWWTGPAPTLGEHTDAVLMEELDISHAELERLRREGVIGTEPRA